MSGSARRADGLRAVGRAAGIGSSRRVIEEARRPFDPLPMHRLGWQVWGWVPYLREWAERDRDLAAIRAVLSRRRDSYVGEWSTVRAPSLPVLLGLGCAARRAGRSGRTIERWARRPIDPFPLIGVASPAERLPGGSLWAYESAVRDWLQRNSEPYLRTTDDRSSVVRAAWFGMKGTPT